jgi:hypothetical protein
MKRLVQMHGAMNIEIVCICLCLFGMAVLNHLFFCGRCRSKNLCDEYGQENLQQLRQAAKEELNKRSRDARMIGAEISEMEQAAKGAKPTFEEYKMEIVKIEGHLHNETMKAEQKRDKVCVNGVRWFEIFTDICIPDVFSNNSMFFSYLHSDGRDELTKKIRKPR